jgi:hypothetical protein
MDLRVHRAISWIGRAEREEGDPDAAFVFLWIGFNAAYADEADTEQGVSLGDRQQFVEFIDRLVALDDFGRLHAAIWGEFRGPVARIMENRFVYRPFWQNLNAPMDEDWAKRWKRSAERFVRAMADRQIAKVLRELFDRLYLLRCQIVHGSTTWNGKVNRAQVTDGAAVLGVLLPVMVDIMMDHPGADWGTPFYPVIGPQNGAPRPPRRT